jgi:kynurenine formamidase
MPGRWIDLTRPIDAALPIYAEPGYRDPPFEATPWCSIETRGFAVWRLALGTQTGTHIDAPRHFAPGGATLDALDPNDLVGRYRHADAATLGDGRGLRHAGEPLLFLDASGTREIAEAALHALLALPCRVWLLAGAPRIAGRDPLHLHRALAAAGRFLVEDLDPTAVPRVPVRGEAIALPLRLTGTGGAPARVLVRSLD